MWAGRIASATMTELSMPTLRQARPEDWEVVHDLLAACDLPVDDLGDDRLDGFLVADVGAQCADGAN